MGGFLGSAITFLLYSAMVFVVRLVVLFATLHDGLIFDKFFSRPTRTQYDYIIVGAGTAGTIILSEMPINANVLLIEAGPKADLNLLNIPILLPTLQRSTLDWSYQTSLQRDACQAMEGRKCQLAAGRGFGGSNLLNNMIYYKGSENDYRGWFKDPSLYDYENDIAPLFRQLENQLAVSELKFRSEFGRAISEINTVDERTGNVSFFTPKVLQRDGLRWTMAHHLRANLRSEKHEIFYNAKATRVLLEVGRRYRVTGIEVKKNNKIFTVSARMGYILTAGAIGTPKILLHSGIGKCQELVKVSLPCYINLRGVGKNLQDHIATGVDLITINKTLNLSLKDVLHPMNAVDLLAGEGRSLWSTVGCEALGFYKPPQFNESSQSPQLGFMVIPMGVSSDAGACMRKNMNIGQKVWDSYFSHLQDRHTVSILPIVLQPKSRGFITLASNNTDDPPIINPKYFYNPQDLRVLVDGIGIIKDHLLKLPQLRRFGAHITTHRLPECAEHFDYDSVDYWECYVRHLSFSVYHLGGTCRMGDPKKSETVVDRQNFLVKETVNLYVADASVMPNLPSGNSNAAVALIAKQFMRVLLKRHVLQMAKLSPAQRILFMEDQQNVYNNDETRHERTEL